MTTTVTLDIATTLTTQVNVTQTAIVQGILDVTVTKATTEAFSTSMSVVQTIGAAGITLANKAVTSSSSASSSPSATTISTIVSSSTSTSTTADATSSEHSSSDSSGALSGSFLSGSSSSTDNDNSIGLVIGIPIAVVGSVLIVLAAWYYLRNIRHRSQEADSRLESRYDEKFNYRASPTVETSPYNMRTVYQVKAKQESMRQSETTFASVPPRPHLHFNNESELSLKEPPTGPINSKWNLNTPLSKWFAKHSQVSSDGSSRGSLSTAPFSPIVALKEFKLNKSKRNEINEKSPILPRFPEASYHPQTYHSTNRSISSNSSNISRQQVPADFTKHITVPKLQPVSQKKIKNKKKSLKSHYKKTSRAINKPLPEKPITSASTLEGLEQRVYDRIFPTTPIPDLNKTDDAVYAVIQKYSKNLADELSIVKGEYVKVLARHTDGWCLVEKVDQFGKVSEISSGEYLNEARGVIPEMCVSKLRL